MYSIFSLIVTGECNFHCRYCYQEKDDLSLDPATVAKAVDFFFPRFDRECEILFYGGEPLLRADTIRETVRVLQLKNKRQRKNITYSISTNGSLVDDDILDFFDKNRFTVLLSFDGRAQDTGRKERSYSLVAQALENLLDRPGVELLTNSVFTPETVSDLSASIRDIVERGVRDVQISFSTHLPWDGNALSRLKEELSDLRRFLTAYGKKEGAVPVANFFEPAEPGLLGCRAGENRIALSPDGRLWGCHLFYDFYKSRKSAYSESYCFGDLDTLIARHERTSPKVLSRYAGLRMDFFHTPKKFCGLCRDVKNCAICPVDAAFASGIIGRIMPDDCRIRRMVRQENKKLWADFERIGIRPRPPQTRALNGRLSA